MSEQRFTLREAATRLGLRERRLFARLRELKILDGNNLPTPPHREKGWFVVEIKDWTHAARGRQCYSRTLVTPDGLRWLAVRLAESGSIASAAGGQAVSAR